MRKNDIYFIVIALLLAKLFKILIYPNQKTCDITMWTQNDAKHEIPALLKADKFLKCDWLRPVVFKPNLKYLHVKIMPVT